MEVSKKRTIYIYRHSRSFWVLCLFEYVAGDGFKHMYKQHIWTKKQTWEYASRHTKHLNGDPRIWSRTEHICQNLNIYVRLLGIQHVLLGSSLRCNPQTSNVHKNRIMFGHLHHPQKIRTSDFVRGIHCLGMLSPWSCSLTSIVKLKKHLVAPQTPRANAFPATSKGAPTIKAWSFRLVLSLRVPWRGWWLLAIPRFPVLCY